MSASPKLDRIDIRILSELQRNGRETNAKLADKVGLSQSPCLQRVKRLEQAGFIDRYEARLNLTKLTENVTVFTEVTLNGHRREHFVTFETSIRDVANVQACYLVSGGYDYLVHFVARNVGHYQEIIDELLDRNIGIDKYFSYIVIKPIIDRGFVPLSALSNPDR